MSLDSLIRKTYGKMKKRNDFWGLRKKASKKGIFKYYYVYRYYRFLSRHNASIPLSCKLDCSAVFPHGIYGVFISSGASIGKNAVIFHQVTIGSNTIKGSASYGSPEIGDNAYIGTGAKIIGKIKLGNNVRIGANCVVVQDIPDNATVVMNKPRVVIRNEPGDNAFYSYEKS